MKRVVILELLAITILISACSSVQNNNKARQPAGELVLIDQCGPPVERFCGAGNDSVSTPSESGLNECGLEQNSGASCSGEPGAKVCIARPGYKCVSAEGKVQFVSHEILRKCDRPGPRNCPISTRNAKTEIRYLSEEDRKLVADEVISLKLARYYYKPGFSEDRGKQLGFIIEDVAQPSPLVMDGMSRVNMYGYVSALVAAFQEQNQQIQTLKDEIERLKAASTHHKN